VRDEVALTVDDVRLPQPADADLRDDIPDELQIHLGGGHRRRRRRAVRHRDRHVRLGLFAEVHGAVPDATAARFTKPRVAGKIGPAPHDVHGEPRHAQLLAALSIEIDDFGDRLHLAQQADVVELPLLEGRGNQLRLRGPAHLTLDLAHELLDPQRRRVRLLALKLGDLRAGLGVREVDFDDAVREDRTRHHGDERDDILPE
jgi:hypothetical protein